MSETNPSFEDYHQVQIHKAFRAIGKYLVDSLIEAGKCLPFFVAMPAVPNNNVITDAEIQNFVSQSATMEFDRELEVLIRENPIN